MFWILKITLDISFLLTYSYLGMANHLVVHCVPSLDAVNDLSLLVITHSWNHSNSLVEIYIEILVVGINLLYTKTFECLYELVEIIWTPSLITLGSSLLSAMARSKSSRIGRIAATVFSPPFKISSAFSLRVRLR